ncbi:hypothetical protein RvY_03871-5 [Ramazzottius varieornatus]|uniref:Uncharacterized protein n=1 Tax=Ramazzottius varieornatus TaxID=947166 RepID=A0A1D1UT65_RAMVA|nr:hypothetical protein RvY_03871-5 [Ramazzottius varieornatus]
MTGRHILRVRCNTWSSLFVRELPAVLGISAGIRSERDLPGMDLKYMFILSCLDRLVWKTTEEISATVLGETFHSLMVDEAWEVSQIQSITEFLAKYGVYSGVVAAFCLSVKATKPLHLLPTKYVETSSMEKLGDERNIQDYVNAFMKSFLLQGKENLEVVREVLLAVGLPFLDAKLASLGAGGRLWSERDVVESIRKTVDVEMER